MDHWSKPVLETLKFFTNIEAVIKHLYNFLKYKKIKNLYIRWEKMDAV